MKTIVITGASRGIGLTTTKKFLSEGWRVIGTYLNTPIPISHQNLSVIQFDQGNSASIAKTADSIKKTAPEIDAVVNCAGIILDVQDTEADIEKIRKTFEVDVLGIIDFTERLLPNLRKGSHIVNIDSLYGTFSFPIDDTSSTGYRIAKAGLNMYTRTLAFRLKDRGIIASSLDPGWVKTDMGNKGATETEKPDREPEEPAEDIYHLVTAVHESGYFWKLGKKREW
ncbi:MAG: SDR family NAD(P)-dependent oxidoreductase [Candidatus Liptonbacteria bacterium]|nr:SDR family NAD(P)-dependent oxidoreductase [Candidatus Liptonbacteria bacterium]